MSTQELDVPYVGQVHLGSTGQHVAAYQRMLHRWNPNVRGYWAAPSEDHAFFGLPMQSQVKRFQGAWSENHPAQPKIPQSGVIGPATHGALSHWADSRAAALLTGQLGSDGNQARQITAAAARCALARRGQMVYSGPHTVTINRRWQGIQDDMVAPSACPEYADCSSLATWCLWNARNAGASDPSQNSWGWGSTLSMYPHGRSVPLAQAEIGDLVFYGTGPTNTTHVAIVVDHGQGIPFVVSFGSPGGPSYVAANYRSDIVGAKSYIAA